MGPDTEPGDVVEAVLEAAAGNTTRADLIDLRVGAYWVVVQTSAGTGMASALRSEEHLRGQKPIGDAGRLLDLSLYELTGLLRSDSPPEAAIGLAAANAVLGPAAPNLSEEGALAVLRERGRGRRVAMIGHFPFADELRDWCRELWVFERGINRQPDDLGQESMDQLLPSADVVAVTATTILNRTLADVLRRVRPEAFLIMLGPSTPLTPRLFEFGFDVLCGTFVDDPESVLLAVSQGAVTSQITGVRRVALWRTVKN
jgi:uncharacterized protein (DUF4213/DUF364 family)